MKLKITKQVWALTLFVFTLFIPFGQVLAQDVTFEFVDDPNSPITTPPYPYAIRDSEGNTYHIFQDVDSGFNEDLGVSNQFYFQSPSRSDCQRVIYGISATSVPDSSASGTMYVGDCNGANGSDDFASLSGGERFSVNIAASTGSEADGEEDFTPTCQTEGGSLAWIGCPLLIGMLNASEAMANFIGSLLRIRPITTAADDPVFLIWQGTRNIALALLVIGALIAIFSEALSISGNAYAVRKMLPRLGVVAVSITLSYYIAAIFIDFFNVLGGGMLALISSVTSDLTITVEALPSVLAQLFAVGIVGGALATFLSGAVLAGLVVILMPVVLALLTALVVITLRHVLIIALVIAAPIAFVGWLLPNTEWSFRRWYKLFGTLLMMYPIIMVLLGSSTIFAYIITGGALTSNEELTISSFDQFVNYLLALVAVGGVMFLIPFTMKASSGLLGRVAGMVNDPNRGMFDKIRGRAQEARTGAAEKKRQDKAYASRTGRYPFDKDGKSGPIRRTRRGLWRASHLYNTHMGAYSDENRAEVEGKALNKDQRIAFTQDEARQRQKGVAKFEIGKELEGMSESQQGKHLKEVLLSVDSTPDKKSAAAEYMLNNTMQFDDVENWVNQQYKSQAMGKTNEIELARRIKQENAPALATKYPHMLKGEPVYDSAGTLEDHTGLGRTVTSSPEDIAKMRPGEIKRIFQIGQQLIDQNPDRAGEIRAQLQTFVNQYESASPSVRDSMSVEIHRAFNAQGPPAPSGPGSSPSPSSGPPTGQPPSPNAPSGPSSPPPGQSGGTSRTSSGDSFEQRRQQVMRTAQQRNIPITDERSITPESISSFESMYGIETPPTERDNSSEA